MQYDQQFSFGRIKILHDQRFENRPTIIFLHDSLGCIELWRDFPGRLGEMTGCNVFVYDRLGYGKSGPFTESVRTNDYMEIEADRLNEILTRLNIEEAILFGHSDGGSIALIAASKYPLVIGGIITEGAHIFVEDITLEGINEAADKYRSTDLPHKLRKYHGENTEAMFSAWTDTWRRESFRSWNIEHVLPSIECPSLIIQGENDEYGTLLQVESIVKQTTGQSRSLILPGVGHTPHKAAVEEVLRQSAAFIGEL